MNDLQTLPKLFNSGIFGMTSTFNAIEESATQKQLALVQDHFKALQAATTVLLNFVSKDINTSVLAAFAYEHLSFEMSKTPTTEEWAGLSTCIVNHFMTKGDSEEVMIKKLRRFSSKFNASNGNLKTTTSENAKHIKLLLDGLKEKIDSGADPKAEGTYTQYKQNLKFCAKNIDAVIEAFVLFKTGTKNSEISDSLPVFSNGDKVSSVFTALRYIGSIVMAKTKNSDSTLRAERDIFSKSFVETFSSVRSMHRYLGMVESDEYSSEDEISDAMLETLEANGYKGRQLRRMSTTELLQAYNKLSKGEAEGNWVDSDDDSMTVKDKRKQLVLHEFLDRKKAKKMSDSKINKMYAEFYADVDDSASDSDLDDSSSD